MLHVFRKVEAPFKDKPLNSCIVLHSPCGYLSAFYRFSLFLEPLSQPQRVVSRGVRCDCQIVKAEEKGRASAHCDHMFGFESSSCPREGERARMKERERESEREIARLCLSVCPGPTLRPSCGRIPRSLAHSLARTLGGERRTCKNKTSSSPPPPPLLPPPPAACCLTRYSVT